MEYILDENECDENNDKVYDNLKYICDSGKYDEFAQTYNTLEKTSIIPIGEVLEFLRLTINSSNATLPGISKIQKFLRNKLFTLNGIVNLRRVALVHKADVNMSCKGYTDLLLYKHFLHLQRTNQPFDDTALFILQNANFVILENYVKYGLIDAHHTEKDIIRDPDNACTYMKAIKYEKFYMKFYIDIFIEIGLMKDIGNIIYKYMVK